MSKHTIPNTKKDTLSIIAAYTISRIACSIFVYLGHMKRDYLSKVPGGWEGVDSWWLNPWTTYDSVYYLNIAANGYEPHTTAFFPLYPLLIKVFGPDFIHMAISGVVLSHLFFLTALFFIFKITRQEHGTKTAHTTIWVLCFFPSAAFFGAVYTESLFLLLTAVSFWAMRNKHWGICALAALAAALTRNPGVLLAAALYIEVRKDKGLKNEPGKKWGITIAPVVGFSLVQIYYWMQFGNPAAGVVSQEYYSRQLMWPWKPILMDIKALLYTCHDLVAYFFTGTAVFLTILTAVLIIYGVHRKFPPSYLILIGGITLMNLVYARLALPSTMCGIRYMGALFPFSQLLALIYCRLHRYPLLTPALISCQAFMFMVYSYYYGFKVAF